MTRRPETAADTVPKTVETAIARDANVLQSATAGINLTVIINQSRFIRDILLILPDCYQGRDANPRLRLGGAG